MLCILNILIEIQHLNGIYILVHKNSLLMYSYLTNFNVIFNSQGYVFEGS